MSKTVTIGRRLIPLDHIALVEPFDPAANPRMQSERPFQARIVLIDRESVLTEQAPSAFAEEHGFRMLPEDGVGTNPGIRFGVESFEPAEGFNPAKPYKARLLWRDLDGNTQSKLLLTLPERVLAIAVTGDKPGASAPGDGEASVEAARTSRRGPRRTRRRAEADLQPV